MKSRTELCRSLCLQLCFLCKKARFGIFSRGSKCEMCKQSVCGKCQSKVRRKEGVKLKGLKLRGIVIHCKCVLVLTKSNDSAV